MMMKALGKILGLSFGLISINSFADCPYSGNEPIPDIIKFYFNHVQAKPPFDQPQAKDVSLHIEAIQKNFFGLTVHSARTPKGGLSLTASHQDCTYSTNSAPIPTGSYAVEVRCNSNGHESLLRFPLIVPDREPHRWRVFIDVACPVNSDGLTLLAPQIIRNSMLPNL